MVWIVLHIIYLDNHWNKSKKHASESSNLSPLNIQCWDFFCLCLLSRLHVSDHQTTYIFEHLSSISQAHRRYFYCNRCPIKKSTKNRISPTTWPRLKHLKKQQFICNLNKLKYITLSHRARLVWIAFSPQ